jgi:hypothetical protein
MKTTTRKAPALFVASTLHDHTYGITSDPLTQFACIFSAFIHDVDHIGVPNTQLIKENTTIAGFKGRVSPSRTQSISPGIFDGREQESQTHYLRQNDGIKRFRQLYVNCHGDRHHGQDLKALRNGR